ncbi:MAG: DMT family transporter [Saccharospirillum sp.]|nr:DMT family transporter [Saccharospirillum sp.]
MTQITANSCTPNQGLTTVLPLESTAVQRLLGYAAALTVVIIWSGYFLSLRQGALSPLGTLELTFFRFAVPAFLLLPLALHRWRRLLAVNPIWLIGMTVGAGLPFFLISAVAMQTAPVAHGSTLIPGTAPLFVTTLAVLAFRQHLSVTRGIGLLAVVVGIGCLLLAAWVEPGRDLWLAQLMLLFAGLMWALFTISLRQSGLGPMEAAAVVTLPSTLVLLLYMLFTGTGLQLDSLPTQEWLVQMAVQGLAVGLGAGFLYGFAVRTLGAETTSALGSLTPVVATLAALSFFQESIEMSTLVGLSLVTLGVVCASGLLNPKRRH